MSKSNGAILTVSLLEEKGYDPLAFRFMALSSHYRKQLLFTYDALDQAQSTYKKLRSKVLNIVDEGERNEEQFNTYNDKFIASISDDLNTANALAVLYEVIKDNKLNGHTKLELIKKFDGVFALDLTKPFAKKEIDEKYIEQMIEKRSEAKKNKDYALADQIRDELAKQCIILKDTPEKTVYEVK
jgi:cysteinyl-tRNA synthetase